MSRAAAASRALPSPALRAPAVRSLCALALLGCHERPGAHPGKPCARVPELVLEKALPVEGPKGFEPSGLALVEGKLLTVSDGDDHAIYELELGPSGAVAKVAIRLKHGPDSTPPFDLEGIAAGARAGTFLLASEAQARVLHVSEGGLTRWWTPSLTKLGNRKGLLQLKNAGLEGVAWLGQEKVLLAAERSAAGLLEVDGTAAEQGEAFTLADSACLRGTAKTADLSDLTTFDGQVFALARSEQRVVRFERAREDWRAVEAWSYGETEDDARFSYCDRTFHQAEGLAVDERNIYVIVDNNETNGYSKDPEDQRPTLFVFHRP